MNYKNVFIKRSHFLRIYSEFNRQTSIQNGYWGAQYLSRTSACRSRSNGKAVVAIEYSPMKKWRIKSFTKSGKQPFAKFNLTCMHIYHSLGAVNTGEICLFVFCIITTSLKRYLGLWNML